VNCPNDAFELRQVTVTSHYGQPVTLDQCPGCGGIWFDESELFRARQGEAEKIDPLDFGALKSPAKIKEAPLCCPRDGAALFRFEDKHFPDSVFVVRCPSCHGIWLNQGEFTKFQKYRGQATAGQQLNATGKPDEVFIEAPAQNNAVDSTAMLGRLGRFLSTDLESNWPTSGSKQQSAAAENTAGAAIGILITILRVLLRL
jgi:Zn-finger nucleic acid-binding protein